jgi:hypothetical protein
VQQQQREIDMLWNQGRCRRAANLTTHRPFMQEGWRVLDPKAYDKPWDIPWGGGAVAGGMALWLLSFGLTAFVLMPFAYTRLVGVALWDLGPEGQADFALWTELVQVLETFAVIYLVTRK